MTAMRDPMVADFAAYSGRLQQALAAANLDGIAALARALHECWREDRNVYLCGNGGSAGNAVHLANDLVYGIAKEKGVGMRANALPANTSILTCLANDLQYADIFSAQLKVYGRKDEVLVVLSGSGNSPNILKALETARELGMKSFAVLGYAGGKAKQMADVSIHFPVDDMQIAEDLQLVVGHMVMQWLYTRGRG